jgi:hypothetical protein
MANTTHEGETLSIMATRSSIDKKGDTTCIDNVDDTFRREHLSKYPLLTDKSDEELEQLNKSVLRKLDWKFLPCITMMLLMKYAYQSQ